MLPSVTSENQSPEVRHNAAAYDMFITFSALAGLIADEDGKLTKMTQDQFCQMAECTRMSCLRWKKEPGFAEKVRARRGEVVPLARESIAFNQLFMLGMQTQDKRAAVDALKTYLGHFSSLQLPTQRQEVKVEHGWADLLAAAQREGAIEGEVIYAADSQTGPADPRSLPETS